MKEDSYGRKEESTSIKIDLGNPLIIIVCILALLFLVVACACIYSLKKAADQARRDRVVTIIGNIEYFNNSPSISRVNQVAH